MSADIKALEARLREPESVVVFAGGAMPGRMLANALASAIAERDEARAERDELRAAVLGGDPDPRLKHGNFLEMARDLHRAQKWGLARAEAAEARLEELTRERDEAKAAKDDAIADHRLFALHRKKQGDHDTKIIEGLQARLEEAKAVLERPLIYEIEDGGGEIHLKLHGVEIGVFAFDSPEAIALLKFDAEARAFLHQGGSDPVAATHCAHCANTGWVDDQNWSPDYPGLPQDRVPGNGKIRCMALNCEAGGSDAR